MSAALDRFKESFGEPLDDGYDGSWPKWQTEAFNALAPLEDLIEQFRGLMAHYGLPEALPDVNRDAYKAQWDRLEGLPEMVAILLDDLAARRRQEVAA